MKLSIIFVLTVALAVLSFAYYQKVNAPSPRVEILREASALKLLRPKEQIVIQQSDHSEIEEGHEEPTETISQDSIDVNYDHNSDEIYEEFCIDWTPGLACILDKEINISTMLFNPDTGYGRMRQAHVILESVNFSNIMQELSTKKSHVESYTIEQDLNDKVYDMVANKPDVDGGKFSCSDDVCGAVFMVDKWDHWSDFVETSGFHQIRLGNLFVSRVDSPNTPGLEFRVIITPGSEPTIQY